MIKKGFTLVEIMLYFSMLSIVLFSLIVFSMQILDINLKSSNSHSLNSNVDLVMSKILNSVHDASSINESMSLLGVEDGLLYFELNDPIYDPVQIYKSGDDVYLKYGTDAPFRLNSDDIVCESLIFSFVDEEKVPDQVLVNAIFTAPINQEFEINTAISLRK